MISQTGKNMLKYFTFTFDARSYTGNQQCFINKVSWMMEGNPVNIMTKQKTKIGEKDLTFNYYYAAWQSIQIPSI